MLMGSTPVILEIHMKVFIEIGEMTDKIIEWINSGEYKETMEALNGETKDEIFRNTCFTLPAVILTKCTKYQETVTE